MSTDIQGERALVVLGNRTEGVLLNDELLARLEQALTTFSRGSFSHLILAGGPNPNPAGSEYTVAPRDVNERIKEQYERGTSADRETLNLDQISTVLENAGIEFPEETIPEIPESKMMEAYVRVVGPPGIDRAEQVIFREEQSSTTIENALHVWEVIREHIPNVTEIALVTSDYHSHRARYIFEKTFPRGYLITTGDTVHYEPEEDYEARAMRNHEIFFSRLDAHQPDQVRDNKDKQHIELYREKMSLGKAELTNVAEILSRPSGRRVVEVVSQEHPIRFEQTVLRVAALESGSGSLDDINAKTDDLADELRNRVLPLLEEHNIIQHDPTAELVQKGSDFEFANRMLDEIREASFTYI